ncbi:MAG: hypothetical protein K0U74_08240 [Alphaproteobacteria bacterium]|nr:hypothetical protein [Alphaproteobacteria bacterium]
MNWRNVVLPAVGFFLWGAIVDGAALAQPAKGVRGDGERLELKRRPVRVEIKWRVENSFRLFSDPSDTAIHRATWLDLDPDEKKQNPVLAAERALAARFDDGWAQPVSEKTCWDSEKNIYACKAGRRDYIKPKQHIVIAELVGVPAGERLGCSWLTTPPKKSGKRGEAITQPCSQQVKLAIPYPWGARVEVRIGGRRVALKRVKVTDLFVVGMGDSFASGEGNPDVPVRFSRERAASYAKNGPGGRKAKTAKNDGKRAAGKKSKPVDLDGFPARVGPWREIGDDAFIKENARWQDQACHRSLYSHQLRAALQLAIEEPHRAVTFVGLACSGAAISQGLFLRYKGNEWVPRPPEYSQISAAAEAQCAGLRVVAKDMPEAYHMKGALPELEGGLVLRECPRKRARKIDLLLVSVGGNDIGFAKLLANAVLDDRSALKKLSGWLGGVHGTIAASQLIDVLDERYKAFNRALHYILHIPWDEADRVILTAYPPLSLVGDGTRVCPDGRAGMEVVKEFRLNSSRARAGVWVSDKLFRKMRASAGKHRWSFVDGHREQFLGRGICAGYSRSALRSADDLRLPRKKNGKWFPYNPADYRAYASRQRWFRTPNDAFMTGNFHVSQSILRKVLNLKALSRFQLTLAATYSGAFHPTAEGQAAIADAVVRKSRRVLQKYERRR